MPSFTKVLVAILAPLRVKGILVLHYLDDILILSQHRKILETYLQEVVSTLTRFGWLINFSKSQLIPTQRMTYLAGGITQHPKESNVASARKDPYAIRDSEQVNGKQVHVSISLPKSLGIPFFMHGEVGQVASTGIPTGVPRSGERIT